MNTAATLSNERKSAISWKRVILGAILSEVVVVAVIGLIVIAHSVLSGPSPEDFGQEAGYYAAAPTALVATFFFGFWAARKLETNVIANGVMVGVVAIVLTAGMIATAKPEHRLMYLASFALRIVGGYFGGLAAQHWKRT
jgi:hypothetical protein